MTATGARRALDAYIDDEEGLAGLVPVDRIIAAVGGVIGGAIVLAAALTYAGIRDTLGIRRARATHPDHMTGRRP